MATETLTIPLADGKIQGDNFYVGDEDDTQYVTLTDGGNLTNVKLEKFGKNSATESGEGAGGDDEFYLDLSGFDDDFNINVMSMDPGDTFYVSGALSWSNVGDVYSINYIGSDGQVHELNIDLESSNGTGSASIVITCFTKGTMIETTMGILAVETLKVGDQILCGDGVARPIRWYSERKVSTKELSQNPEFRPIRIRKNTFGQNHPNRDLVVSPQHRILLNDWRAELLFGVDEVLAPAVHLIDDQNISWDFSAIEVTYYHFMFDEHQTVWSNGLETESFFPGETALTGVSDAAKVELFQLFPHLESNPESYGGTCRPTLKAHEAITLVGS